jgi:hypothetical protein
MARRAEPSRPQRPGHSSGRRSADEFNRLADQRQAAIAWVMLEKFNTPVFIVPAVMLCGAVILALYLLMIGYFN